MSRLKPLDIYNLLPKTNCKECGEETCMAFTYLLISRDKELEDCKPLIKDPKYKPNYPKLKDLLTPPVRSVKFGVGEHAKTIGGEEVMRRHELTWFNPTVLAIDVDDDLEESELIKRVDLITHWNTFYIGQSLFLDAVAIKCVSGDPNKFAKAVSAVVKYTDNPIILCSLDPACLKAGVKAAVGKKPLLYAATKDNWKEVGEIARSEKLPVVIAAPGDLDLLKSLAKSMHTAGVEEIALDPGTYWGEGLLGDTINNFTMLRRAAIEAGDREVGWPLIGVPATIWIGKEGISEGEKLATAFQETILSAILTARYADLLIIHSTELWTFLPLVILKRNLYEDPRVHPSVDSELMAIGSPDQNSPVMVTTNFALTAYTVKSDLEQSKIDAWLVILDTEGIGVESAAAGGQFNASKISDSLEEFKVGDKVNHRALIIPGMGSRFKGEIEDLSGWDVYVGPKDSGAIGDFLKEKYRAATGLKYVGDPGKESPVFLTPNNIKAFYDVKKPLLDAKASAWLVVVDTEGLDFESALKEKKIDAAAVKKSMDEGGVDEQVSKKELIIPPALEALKGAIESATKWKAKVVAPDKISGMIK
ncbi:MAG: acetyl-CoA decarbonylase/synthase complex subunit gamma [Candidatus Jordarchaeum sp.]|uniref:acetyl-CoA decarbonylase/synthase complex subunit gamma n=1 Tax=Candidatus Jordarchaeum sp. TaxID=2823881 RepID=UPI00404936F9